MDKNNCDKPRFDEGVEFYNLRFCTADLSLY